MTRRSLGIGILLALVIGAAGALWAGLATGAEGPTTITKCTTAEIEKAVEKGGAYLLQCEGETFDIQAPKPAKTLTGGISPGFKVAAKKSVSFTAALGNDPTFENAQARSSRIFTVAAGGSLTLTHVILSASVTGPAGISAGKAKTDGQKGEKGEEEEELAELEEELANEGPEGESAPEVNPESSTAGGDGTAGTSGGFIAGKALNAPAVQGGAISNAGTVTLDEDEFAGDSLVGGIGGNGGGGGGGGSGGGGGTGGSGSNYQECGETGFPKVGYDADPPGSGGDGAQGGDGGPGTPAGNGGEALGGAIYNSGTLTVQGTGFHFNVAIGGVGGNGGSGGKGGNGGNAGFGYPGGDGGAGGNAGPGAAAGSGASGLGGAIYNTGKLTVEGSQFEEDTAQGGQSGTGGEGGSAGKGGGGGLAFSGEKCEANVLKTLKGAGGNGADGGLGAEGGNGANGGNAEGGAIYSTTAFTLTSTDFAHDSLEAGLGATGNCEDYLIPCPGKGSGGGEGGEAGSGEPSGSSGNKGARTGAAGKSGTNGLALDALVFGPAEGETPQESQLGEEGKVNPPGSSSSNSSSSKSSGSSGGKGDSDDDGDDSSDDAKVSDSGHASTKQSGSGVTVETGETVTCPPGSDVCTATVSASTAEKATASTASRKHVKAKPKVLVIGHTTLTVAAGHSVKVILHLNGKGVALLRKRHRLSIRVTDIVILPGEAPVTHTGTLTISEPKTAHKRR